jgi:replicative DNA helicase
VKVLLRSTFATGNEPHEALLNNFRMLEASSLGFEDPNDNAIWTFVKDFTLQHHHPPNITTIRAHFERSNLVTVVDRLEAVALTKPKMMGDFEHYLNAKAEDRRRRLVGTYLQEATEILMKGIEIKTKGEEKELLIGPHAAMRFLMDKAHDILTPVTGVKLSGEVTADADDYLAEYQRVKNDPLSGIGQFMGIRQVDETLGGAKRHELWIHAAFTGHMKSSLMLNWAYNQAVFFKHDVLIFSLEMPYSQCRRLLYALHSAHEKFRDRFTPLDYARTRDGQLTPEEEEFLKISAMDFKNGGYGRIHIEVADPNKVDFTVADMRHRAETIYASTPFQLMFVDHALLVAPRKWVPSTTDRLNEVIRDCKRLAMSFNKGMGMAVVLLFQISREGFKAARKARGLDSFEKDGQVKEVRSNHVYNLTFLSYANEAERSADVVTATWKDEELTKNNQVLMQNLKSRDNAPFDPFVMGVEWCVRRIFSLDVNLDLARKIGEEIDLSDTLSLM